MSQVEHTNQQHLSESEVREACLRVRISRLRNCFRKCQIHFPNLQKGVVGVQMQLGRPENMPSMFEALGSAQTGSGSTLLSFQKLGSRGRRLGTVRSVPLLKTSVGYTGDLMSAEKLF